MTLDDVRQGFCCCAQSREIIANLSYYSFWEFGPYLGAYASFRNGAHREEGGGPAPWLKAISTQIVVDA